MKTKAGRAERWFKRETEGLDETLERSARDAIPGESQERLRGYASGSATSGRATVWLLELITYQGALGCKRVLENDESGWTDLDLTCSYGFWEVHALAAAYDVDPSPTKHARTNLDNAARVWPSGANRARTWSIGCAAASLSRTQSGTGAASAEVARRRTTRGQWRTFMRPPGMAKRRVPGKLVSESRVGAYGERRSPIALTGFSRATFRCSS
jgi:hypothetical protein